MTAQVLVFNVFSEKDPHLNVVEWPSWQYYAKDNTLYFKYDQASNLWQQLELASELKSDLRHTVDWGKNCLVDFNVGKTQLVLFDRSNKAKIKKLFVSIFRSRLKHLFWRCRRQYFLNYSIKFLITFFIFLKFISCFSFWIRNKERKIENVRFCHVNQQS